MKRTVLYGLIFCLLLVFTACTEKIISEENHQNNGRVVGFVHGIVKNANTSQVLGDVEISWVSKGKYYSTRSNSHGYYAITNLNSGSYELTFKGPNGFTIQTQSIIIPDLSAIGIDDVPTDEDFNYSMVLDKALYQTNAAIFGYIGAQTSTSEISIVPNMKVIARVSNMGFVPYFYEATTDNTGKYQFNNLPALDGTIEIYTQGNTLIGDYLYSSSTVRNVMPIYNQSVQAPSIILNINPEDVVILSHTAEEYIPGSHIEFTFNKEINANSFKLRLLYNGSALIDSSNYSISWLNPKKVRVTFNSNYNLAANTYYRFEMSGLAKSREVIPNFNITYDMLTGNY